jgi:hypothetical protein
VKQNFSTRSAARQGKSDNISERIQKIQTLGSKFREAALTDCTEGEIAGIFTLSVGLQNTYKQNFPLEAQHPHQSQVEPAIQ